MEEWPLLSRGREVLLKLVTGHFRTRAKNVGCDSRTVSNHLANFSSEILHFLWFTGTGTLIACTVLTPITKTAPTPLIIRTVQKQSPRAQLKLTGCAETRDPWSRNTNAQQTIPNPFPHAPENRRC